MAPLDRLPGKDLWAGLKNIPKVARQREVNGKTSTETTYFISSLKNHTPNIAKAIRDHWKIENSLHPCLEVGFRKDHCRVHKDHGLENFAILRHMAISLLKRERSLKDGIQTKRLKTAWDPKYC